MEGKDQNGNLLPAANGFYKLLTTIKHYAANNSEVNRRSGSSDMDDRTLREYYTKAFRGITQAAHEGSVMSSYNSVNGTPTAASTYLMDTLLRQTFGFTGYVTSRLRRDRRDHLAAPLAAGRLPASRSPALRRSPSR